MDSLDAVELFDAFNFGSGDLFDNFVYVYLQGVNSLIVGVIVVEAGCRGQDPLWSDDDSMAKGTF